MLFSFPPQSDVYSEVFTPNGSIRPQWGSFFEKLSEHQEKIPYYSEQTARLMQADMLTVKEKQTHGVIPFILSSEDFTTIESGLIQRAEIFNAMLADLYGEQKLITQGIIPPAAVFGNPAYYPALKNLTPHEGIFVQEYAAELERSPDGKFWVVADYLQIPKGVGRTIKNRQVLTRVMPDIYESSCPARVSDFFESFRHHLFSNAPKNKIPLVVLLTETTHRALSFEEAYFARNLGISAVEPADLTVRDNKVYLKNIDGLKQVDVILRRIEDALCDPLELNGASAVGVAGLVQAVRSGTVALINPLGTGLGESPVFKAYIHGIARYFNNGKELILPSIATWWGGQPAEAQYLIDHHHSLRFINAFTGAEALPSIEDLKDNPANYAGMETVKASEMPIIKDGQLENARIKLRIPVIYDGGKYRVMAGGLAFTKTKNSAGISDIWVKAPSAKISENRSCENVSAPIRTTFELTSRIADNMFWLGRNLERSEQLARLLRVALTRATQGSEFPDPNDVATLLSVLAYEGHLSFTDFNDSVEREKTLRTLKSIMCASSYDFGLHALFCRLKEMADQLHDRLSMDTWELFTSLKPILPEESSNYPIILNRLDNVILRQNALSGLIREDMTRDHSWRFMEIGRRLERGLQILNLLQGIECCHISGFEPSLESLLETSDSRMTYRVRYMALPTVPLVADLLICDKSNPRALIYQVLKLKQNISVLERESRLTGLFAKETDILQDTIDSIESINIEQLNALTGLLNNLRDRLQLFSDTLTLSCFIHTASTRQGPTYNKGKMK